MIALSIVAALDGPEADELRVQARTMAERLDRGVEERANAPRPTAPEPDPDDPLRDGGDEAPRRRAAPPGDPYRDAAKRGKQPKPPARSKPPRGGLSIQFGADGSTTIGTDDGDVTLNAPISDDDGRPRSTDALDVARRLLASTSAQELDARAFAFVEACVVLARANEPLPAITDARRRAVAELAVAACTRDPARVVAVIRAARPDVAEDLAWFATPLALEFAAKELGQLALEGLVTTTTKLTEGLVAVDPALCLQVVERSNAPMLAAIVSLQAEDAGNELPALAAHWLDYNKIPDPAQSYTWRALRIRWLLRRDLDAALAVADEDAGDTGPDFQGSIELAIHLAKLHPDRAVAKARQFTPHVDHAGWIVGLTRARVDGIGALLDDWIAKLTPATYDPWAYFAELLACCIEQGEVERVKRCIAAGGPTGWQIACAAHHAFAKAEDRGTLLAACYERVSPGCVAGRAMAAGMFTLGAGKMVRQPAWLAFTDPHPIETLALAAALGAAMPRWD